VSVLPARNTSGAGGSRTLVRTRKPCAFYMLIPDSVFVRRQDLDHSAGTLSPKTSPAHRGLRWLFPILLRRLTLGFGTTPLERRLVRLPCKRIKLVIYCTSIKQREHTRCCQLLFRPNGLWSLQPSLRMLTHHFVSPSNPVNPILAMAVAANLGGQASSLGKACAKVTLFLETATFFRRNLLPLQYFP